MLLSMRHRTKPDATHLICAAGNHISKRNRKKKPFYYDTFATIFYPDTFTYPLNKRLIPEYNPGEDPSYIPIHEKFLQPGDFSQYTMMELFRKVAKTDQDGLFPLRSCFGGVALYKAATWLTPHCQYTLQQEKLSKYQNLTLHEQQRTVLRYAASNETVPCEHIVFHDCLHRKVFKTNSSSIDPLPRHLTIDPLMLTQWKSTPTKFI